MAVVQILQPLETQPFGPGFLWRAASDFAGPILPNSFFELTAFPATGEEIIGKAIKYVDSQLAIGVLGEQSTPGSTVWRIDPQVSSTPAGAAARLQVQFVDQGTTVVDQDTIPITWNMDAASYVLSQKTGGTTDASFTESDRVTLQTTSASVISSLPLNTTPGALADLGVDVLQAGPPIELLGTSNDFLLTGRGSIDRVSGATGIYAYGCRWTLETAPAGLGKVQGVVDEYEQRIVQFALMKGSAGGFEYIDQLVNDHMGGGQMTWGIPFPKRLEFSILPFCTLRFRWLLFLQAP
jgi:hypothetical protein